MSLCLVEPHREVKHMKHTTTHGRVSKELLKELILHDLFSLHSQTERNW